MRDEAPPVDDLRRAAAIAAALWPRSQRTLAAGAAVDHALSLDADPPAPWPRHLDALRRIELVVHGVLLAAWIAARRDAGSGPGFVVGLNGGQGSGKSTLSALTCAALERILGLRAIVLSLDDLYLTRPERAELARREHPLLATRGVPGTHDTVLGERLLEALADPDGGVVAIPRFDKAVDDRRPAAAWDPVRAPVDVVLFEGWCVGAPAEPEGALATPCNALEAEEDPEGRWRRYVNAQLAGPYAGLFARLDALVMLRVPDFDAVRRWRREQEDRLRTETGRGMDGAALERFVAHYERITRHQLAVLPRRADLRFDLALDHAIARIA